MPCSEWVYLFRSKAVKCLWPLQSPADPSTSIRRTIVDTVLCMSPPLTSNQEGKLSGLSLWSHSQRFSCIPHIKATVYFERMIWCFSTNCSLCCSCSLHSAKFGKLLVGVSGLVRKWRDFRSRFSLYEARMRYFLMRLRKYLPKFCYAERSSCSDGLGPLGGNGHSKSIQSFSEWSPLSYDETYLSWWN